MRNIAIYAETGESVGLGHLIRCSAIAEELCKKNKVMLLTSKGFNVSAFCVENIRYLQIVSPRKSNEMFMVSLKNILEKEDIEIVLLDSYYITYKILFEINKCYKLVVFDGNCKYPANVDMVINYTLKANREIYIQHYDRKVMLAIGCEYFPLRASFRQTDPISIEKKVKNIFVSVGASSVSIEIIRLFLLIKEIDEDLNIYAAGDKKLHDLGEIKKDKKIHLFSNIKDIEIIMKKCDVAVTAAGTTIYELMFLGIPTVTFAIAENQLSNKHIKNILLWCGLIDIAADKYQWNKYKKIIQDRLCILLESYDVRKKMSEDGMRFIDGLGAVRIAGLIEKLE